MDFFPCSYGLLLKEHVLGSQELESPVFSLSLCSEEEGRQNEDSSGGEEMAAFHVRTYNVLFGRVPRTAPHAFK